MPIGLRLNTAQLTPLRNLSKSVAEGESARERLSSGLRIIKASDDAAGLAVASRVDLDRRVYNQGLRNVNDGISYLNVAEDAANELGNIVTRLKELSTQASSTTLATGERSSLNKEATSLSQEYNRIIRYVSFNNKDVLSTSEASLSIGAGYSGASINLNLAAGRGNITYKCRAWWFWSCFWR
jgi:flagellin